MQASERMSGARRRMLHVLDETDPFARRQREDVDWWEEDVHARPEEAADIVSINVGAASVGVVNLVAHLTHPSSNVTPPNLALVVNHFVKANTAITEVIQKSLAEPHRAVIDGQEVAYANIEEKFAALSKAWRRHVRGKSIISYSHPAYFQVMGMGRAAVPLLLS